MYIHKLSVTNFRNFSTIEMFFERGFHTIIGSNNIGKSNLLHALRLVLDQNLSNNFRFLLTEDLHNLKNVSKDTYVKISVEIKGDDLIEIPNFPLIRTSDETAEISYFFAHKSKFYSSYNKETLVYERDFSWRLYGGKELDINSLVNMNTIPFSELDGIKVNLITDFRDIYKHLKSSRNTLFRDFLKSRPTYDEDKNVLEDVLEIASRNLNEKQFISDISSEIDNKNEVITSKHFAESYFLDFDSISETDLWDSISLYFKVNGEKLSISKLGLGQKNILFLALYILSIENNSKSNPLTILLIEEPEAHLHPQLQRLLFRKLSNIEKTQVIMTSHSAQIASDVEYKNMAVLYKLAGITKSYTPFSQVNLDPDVVNLLKRYFDVTRSELFFAEKIILVEGITEKFIIESIMKQVYNYDLLDNNVSIVPIHGRHFHSFLPFFDNNNYEIEVYVVMDGDEQNKDDADFVTPAKIFEERTNGRIKIFNSHKTLELELFPNRITNQFYLKSIFTKLKHNQSHSNLNNSTDEWDSELMRRIENTISKGRFAQQLSIEIDNNFIVPEYIDNMALEILGT